LSNVLSIINNLPSKILKQILLDHLRTMISRVFLIFFAESLDSPQAKAQGQGRTDEDDQGGGEKNGEEFHRMAKVIGDLQHDEAEGHDAEGDDEEEKIEYKVYRCFPIMTAHLDPS
jgi:hypothetical protein